MPKKAEEKRMCGNCRYHNAYEYPDKVFCFARFSNREKPVVSIFDSCNEWESKLQECYCLEEALAKRDKNPK